MVRREEAVEAPPPDEVRFTHKLLKALRTGDRELKPGDLVDASEWRNAALLEARRRIEPLPSSPFRVFSQQRAKAEATLRTLAEEETRVKQELEQALAEEKRLSASVHELTRAAARLADERRALSETTNRVAVLRLRLTGKSGRAVDVDTRCIPSDRAVAKARIAECDRLLAQLTGEVVVTR